MGPESMEGLGELMGGHRDGHTATGVAASHTATGVAASLC